MRCLFLDHNLAFVNPTRNHLLDVLRRAAETVVFGAGYVSADEFRAGPAQFAAHNGPFDLVIGTEHIILPHYREQSVLAERAYRAYAFRYDPHLMTSRALFEFFRNFDGPRLLTFFESDFYNFGEAQMKLIEGSGAICVGMGRELMGITTPEAAASDLSETDRAILDRTENRWTNFTASNPERIISSTHFVAASEIGGRPFAARSHGWAIPGAHYTARVQAKHILDAAGIPHAGKYLDYVLPIAGRLKVNLLGRRWGQRLMNNLQRSLLSSVRYAFTCGSVLRMPIRKFFEIPAAGAVLAAQPCAGFADLGYVSGANSFAVAPDELPGLHQEMEADVDRATAIATAGQRVVASLHSAEARARQLRAAFEAVLADDFAGAYWRKGEFLVARHSDRRTQSEGL